MEVCMLDPLFFPYHGGTEKAVLEVGSRLVANHGYEVGVLTSMIPQARGVREERVRGMRVLRTKSLYFEDLPGFLPPPFTITPLLNRDLRTRHKGADIYHFHNRYWYSPRTYSVARRMGKMMLTVHNTRPRGISKSTDFWGGAFDETIGKAIFSMCERINCVSKDAMDKTIPGNMHGKCAVTYNGVDTKRFLPRKGTEEVRRKLGLGSDFVILTNGRFVTQKGMSYLLDAFAEVAKGSKGSKLVLIGRGPLRQQLESRARDLGIIDSVRFTTGIPEDELPSYYNAADLFVLPSLYEPSALVLYEALGCGKPIIATAVGGNQEIIGDCGLIVPPGDPGALASAIKALQEDDPWRQDLGRKARERAVSAFDWDMIAVAWDKSYKACLDGT
jgi:glycosyltransferase involved in cell wall biosynthesis